MNIKEAKQRNLILEKTSYKEEDQTHFMCFFGKTKEKTEQEEFKAL